jgi:hypothetical protein
MNYMAEVIDFHSKQRRKHPWRRLGGINFSRPSELHPEKREVAVLDGRAVGISQQFAPCRVVVTYDSAPSVIPICGNMWYYN